jgi:hypothetical protein
MQRGELGREVWSTAPAGVCVRACACARVCVCAAYTPLWVQEIQGTVPRPPAASMKTWRHEGMNLQFTRPSPQSHALRHMEQHRDVRPDRVVCLSCCLSRCLRH